MLFKVRAPSNYPPEYAVKLRTVALGWNVDETIYEFRERTVELDEYEVSVATCSADTNIQHIYLWLAYSEIVQAVGRARLVNNDCTVHVFAKLPISGCALMN